MEHKVPEKRFFAQYLDNIANLKLDVIEISLQVDQRVLKSKCS